MRCSTYEFLDIGPNPELGTRGLDCNARYLIISLDLDVILPETSTQTVVLHWLQSNFTFTCNGKGNSHVLLPGDDDHLHSSYTAPYIAPQPPPGTHHRYVFLLFNQSEVYDFPQCFEYIPPKTMEARAGFDIRQFMDAAGLDPPVAINYFFGYRKPSHEEHPVPASSVTQTSFRSVDCRVLPTP